MTETYNSLKDPTSDGYAKVELSKTDWKAGKTEPALFAQFDDPTFKKWFVRVMLLTLGFVLAGVGSCAYKANQAHKAEVAKIESAPVELPPIKTQSRNTIATKKVAKKAIQPDLSAASISVVKEKLTTENDSFTSDFETRLKNFERKIP